MCKVFDLPKLCKKANFCAVFSTFGTATEVNGFDRHHRLGQGVKCFFPKFVNILSPFLCDVNVFSKNKFLRNYFFQK